MTTDAPNAATTAARDAVYAITKSTFYDTLADAAVEALEPHIRAREAAASAEWSDAYNELRDKGEPSWDTFDTAMGAALHDHLMAVLGDLESLRMQYLGLQVADELQDIIDRYKNGNPETPDPRVKVIEDINLAILAEWSAKWAGTETGDGLLRAGAIATEIGEKL